MTLFLTPSFLLLLFSPLFFSTLLFAYTNYLPPIMRIRIGFPFFFLLNEIFTCCSRCLEGDYRLNVWIRGIFRSEKIRYFWCFFLFFLEVSSFLPSEAPWGRLSSKCADSVFSRKWKIGRFLLFFVFRILEAYHG